MRGGLVELEFIAQGLQLLHGVEHPEILTPATAHALSHAMGAGIVDPETGLFLREALELYQSIDHILRLALDGPFEPGTAPAPLKRLIGRLGGTDFADLEARLIAAEARVLDIFQTFFGVEQPSQE